MKKLLIFLMVALLLGTVGAANRFGDTYHEIQITDENGTVVDDITALYIYLADTTTNATIYMDKERQNTITIPMTEATTNTTLVDGVVHWWGPDSYDFSMTNGESVGPRTNSGHRARSSAEGTIQFPSYLQTMSTTAWLDAQSITMGTGADWVINGGGTADTLSFTPASDNSAFNIGTSGTSKNSDFNVYVGTLLGLKVDAGDPSLTWDGGAALLNHDSNFNVGINTGTSTGLTSIGSATAGGFAVDTTAGITINADDSYALTVSAGAVTIAAAGATTGDVTVTAADVMSFISADTKLFNGAVAETWIVEGTTDDHEATIVFTDPTADVTWTFPVAAADTFAVMASTLATNAPEIANSVTGGTNQLIFEGTLDAFETILTAEDATADATVTLPDDTGSLTYIAEGGTANLANAGAVPLTDAVVLWSSTGADAGTLADGTSAGQIITVIVVSQAGGACTLTPASVTGCGYATVVFTAVGESATFMYVDSTIGWMCIGTAGVTTQPLLTQ